MAEKSASEYRGSIHQRQKDLMLDWYQRLDHSAETGAQVELPIGPDHPKYRNWRPRSC